MTDCKWVCIAFLALGSGCAASNPSVSGEGEPDPALWRTRPGGFDLRPASMPRAEEVAAGTLRAEIEALGNGKNRFTDDVLAQLRGE